MSAPPCRQTRMSAPPACLSPHALRAGRQECLPHHAGRQECLPHRGTGLRLAQEAGRGACWQKRKCAAAEPLCPRVASRPGQRSCPGHPSLRPTSHVGPVGGTGIPAGGIGILLGGTGIPACPYIRSVQADKNVCPTVQAQRNVCPTTSVRRVSAKPQWSWQGNPSSGTGFQPVRTGRMPVPLTFEGTGGVVSDTSSVTARARPRGWLRPARGRRSCAPGQ